MNEQYLLRPGSWGYQTDARDIEGNALMSVYSYESIPCPPLLGRPCVVIVHEGATLMFPCATARQAQEFVWKFAKLRNESMRLPIDESHRQMIYDAVSDASVNQLVSIADAIGFRAYAKDGSDPDKGEA